MTSLASAKGPSVTLSAPCRRAIREPAALGIRPAVSSSAPALVASSPRAMMPSMSPAGGGAGGWLDVSRIRYRIAGSPFSLLGPAQVHRHHGHPGPHEHDRSGEGQVQGD